MKLFLAWLKRIRPRKAPPEPQPQRATLPPVSLGDTRQLEYVIVEEIKTVMLYIENEANADAYQEFAAHIKKQGYYLQVFQFKPK